MSGYVQPDVEAQTQAPASSSDQRSTIGATAGPTGNMANAAAGGHNTPSIWEQSSHPVALLFLFLFRGLAIATYLLSGFFSTGFVFSTVVVVLFLSADFWTVKNVSGRVLVGLRFWNQVDESGASYWVFESKDTAGQPNNPVDQKMFWAALYSFPVAWVGLLFVGLLKFNLTFIPIVVLALVFNITNAVGFTYADRDAKRRWATGIAAQGFSMGGLSGSLVSGLGRAAMGKVFG